MKGSEVLHLVNTCIEAMILPHKWSRIYKNVFEMWSTSPITNKQGVLVSISSMEICWLFKSKIPHGL